LRTGRELQEAAMAALHRALKVTDKDAPAAARELLGIYRELQKDTRMAQAQREELRTRVRGRLSALSAQISRHLKQVARQASRGPKSVGVASDDKVLGQVAAAGGGAGFGQGGGAGAQAVNDDDGPALVDLIQTVIQPKSWDINGATVIVDYGHNTDALAALIQAMERFPHQRRTCVYTTAGDRRDCDMIRQGELLGAAFDRVVLYEDHYLRGRPEGQIISLFRQGVESGPRAKQIDEIRGADAAVELALRTAQPEDLILVQADTVDETVQFIRHYIESVSPEPIGPEGLKGAVKSADDGKRKATSPEAVTSSVVAATSSVAKV
jgi:hypothetical protein